MYMYNIHIYIYAHTCIRKYDIDTYICRLRRQAGRQAGRQVGAFFFGSERSFELLTASFNRFSQMRASSTDGHIIACFSCCMGIFCCLRTWCVGTCGDGRNLYTTFFDSFGWGETNTTQVRKNNRG